MSLITLFLCGDVMTGRGIDQIQGHPSDPTLHEPYVQSAIEYLELAQNRNGAIPIRAGPAYIWGDALAELARVRPHARIVNLETAITRSQDWAPKGINYRMHPANIDCLSIAQIDCCALANNHVLDWGASGLVETLATLASAGIKSAGAGLTRAHAESPAVLSLSRGGRVLVYALGMDSSGVPEAWAAEDAKPGVYRFDERSEHDLQRLAARVHSAKEPGDIVVASVHWGGNWGYSIADEERRLAHRMIDEAGVDLVHGHSSHHPKAIEIHAGKLILHGCGDFINDYEGIHGNESYHPDLSLMYFPALDSMTGRLERLELAPMRMFRFRVQSASDEEASWLCALLQRESKRWGTLATLRADGHIEVQKSPGA